LATLLVILMGSADARNSRNACWADPCFVETVWDWTMNAARLPIVPGLGNANRRCARTVLRRCMRRGVGNLYCTGKCP